jgi:carbon monoxide dehydrogenase subunit G
MRVESRTRELRTCGPRGRDCRTGVQTLRRALAALATLILLASAQAQPMEVVVRKAGEVITVDVRARVAAEPHLAWTVLTDFDHMADFLSAIKSSQVVSRKGEPLEVAQTGEAKRGFLRFSFATLRAVELVPEHEVRSRLISGSSFKSFEFTTRIDTRGGVTTIVHHGEYVPTTWVPPVIGTALIESETREQFGELMAEMLRRQAARTERR